MGVINIWAIIIAIFSSNLLFGIQISGEAYINFHPYYKTYKRKAPRVALSGADFDFSDAVMKSSLKKVKKALKEGANVNLVITKKKRTALHIASYRGDVELAKVLLEAGAKLEVRDYKKDTPLHLAAWTGEASIVRRLLIAGANPNVVAGRKEGKWTPLFLASLGGHNTSMSELLSYGANLNHRHLNGSTALHWAVFKSYYHCEAVKVLIKAVAFKAKKENKNVAEEIARYIYTPAYDNETPLHWAAKEGRKAPCFICLSKKE